MEDQRGETAMQGGVRRTIKAETAEEVRGVISAEGELRQEASSMPLNRDPVGAEFQPSTASSSTTMPAGEESQH